MKKKLNVDLNDCRVLKTDENENEKKIFKLLLIDRRRKRVERETFFNLKNDSSIEKLSLLLYADFCVDFCADATSLKKRKKSNFLYDLITLQKLRNALTNARNCCYFFNQFADSFNSFLTVKQNE